MADNLSMKKIWELHDYSFTIPYQQRGYKWTKDNIKVLLEDLSNFLDEENPSKIYCLQPITVVPLDKINKYSVIDGQQRLTTLYLLYKYLIYDSEHQDLTEESELYHYKYERDSKDEDRKKLLQNNINTLDDKTIDSFYITNAYDTISNWFNEDNEKIQKFKNLLQEEDPKAAKSIQILWYEVEKEKSHEAFRNINSGKIQLSNSDLIKALFLNRENGINEQTRNQIAIQFEQMERQFAEDRFWHMLCQNDIEPQKGQSRVDLLFNFIEGISEKEYQIDSRKSFYKFSNYKNEQLLEKWKQIREQYQRLKDIFDDPYSFHYVAFLIYCGKTLKEIIEKSKNKKKSKFCNELRRDIKTYISHSKHISVDEYSYNDSKTSLCRLFVLHNIETILQRYSELQKKKNLRFSYEYFPFELLYKQTWNIEHIASQTDNTLKSEIDRKDWINGAKVDYEDIFYKNNVKELLSIAEKDLSNKDIFDNLYREVIKEAEDTDLVKEKDNIGNLVLLDEHTNKSFHNSLFPRKRRIVIMASGLRNDTDSVLEENVESVYVPICTQQVYTKSYSKSSKVKLLSWNKEDFDNYLNDIKEKLSYYFE